MKRRDFLKGIVGAGALIALPISAKPDKWWENYTHKAVPLHKGVIDMTGESFRLIRDIDLAKKHIEEELKSHISSQAYKGDVVFTGFGLAPAPYVPSTRVYDHYLIESDPETSIDAAWEGFWDDYSKKLSKEPRTDIFWRRIVEIDEVIDFGARKEKYIVRCRFSLG